MSDGSYAMGADPSAGSANGESSKVDTAKQEASDLKATATDAAKDVAGTAKSEAADVAHTTKSQATELFHQTQRELSDQAASQQRRLAAGLGALGDEFGSMARNAEGGMAADLVQRVSDRARGAASWLDGRDPAGVLADVKAFARRRPMVFIGAALVAGIAAGRLTRAMISEAKDEAADAETGTARVGASSTVGSSATGSTMGAGSSLGGSSGVAGGIGASGVGTASGAGTAGTWDAEIPAVPGSGPGDEGDLGATDARSNQDEDSPLYSASASRLETTPEEVPDDRRDSF